MTGTRQMALLPTSIQRLTPGSSLRDTVEASLSAAIVSGELEPGAVVSVPALATQFGVSATPVREAMLNLEKLGFVEPLRNKGFRVTAVSEQDLHDLVQVRRWLEAPAMRVAAEKLRGKPVEEYRELAKQISDASARSDFREYLRADSEFHLALVGLTGNRRLTEVIGELRRQTRLVGLVTLSNSAELEISALEHHKLLDLLVAGNADAAEKLMHTHVGHVLGWWSGRVEG